MVGVNRKQALACSLPATLTNLIINPLLDANPTGNGENLTDSERSKTSKVDCALKFTKTKNSISLDSRFVDLENLGGRATLTFCDFVRNFLTVEYSMDEHLERS